MRPPHAAPTNGADDGTVGGPNLQICWIGFQAGVEADRLGRDLLVHRMSRRLAMSIAFAQFVIDCQDPAALAGFWSGVLGVPVDPGASPYFATVGRAGERPLRPAWMFIKVPEPRIGKNRVHADLVATDWAAEVERVVGLGATRVAEFDEYGTRWVTLTDPEGNVFDIGAG